MTLAHGGGVDEVAFIALPILVFVVLQVLNRRRTRPRPDEQENESPGTNDSTDP